MARTAKPKLQLKRVYLPWDKGDGTRVLVERLWPRGIKKEAAGIDHWLKEISPSPKLRSWYGHDPKRWPEFRQRYEAEIAGNPEPFEELRALCRKGPVTLVYAARDEERNSARILWEMLKDEKP